MRSFLNNKTGMSKTGNDTRSSHLLARIHRGTARGTDQDPAGDASRDTAKEIFGDPVGYLASFGVNATLVETRRLPTAA